MGIRTILVPFAYMAAFILRKLGVSIYAVATFSFLLIFVTIGAFYMLFASYSYSELKLYMAITAGGIFLTGLMDEVIRELSRKKKQPSFPLAIARHSDLLLVFGVLYISAVQPYGIVPALTGVGAGVYAAIGVLFLFGVLMVDFVARRIEKRDRGIETRAERMYLLTGFILIGFYFEAFELALFVGIIAVTFYLYAWIIWRKFDFYLAGEALYGALSRLQRYIPRGGLPDIQKPKIPSGGAEDDADDFTEYGSDEYDGSGHNFTAVVNDRKSEPVSNVKISLHNLETDEKYAGYTDPSGRAAFKGVSEGQYDIKLEAEGFKSDRFERYVSMDSGEVFVLKQPFIDLSIVITDKIKTTPIPGSLVIIKPPGEKGGEIRKHADNLGVAYFDELDLGIWEIQVRAAGYDNWEREINLEEENVVSVTLEKGTSKEEGPPEVEKTEEKVEPIEEKEEPKEEELEEPEEREPEAETDEPETQEAEEHKEVGLRDTLSESVIFEYYNIDDVRPLVSRMVEEYKSNDIDTYLVSTPERQEEYADLDVKIVDVPEEPDLFREVLEGMPAGSVLIFEPLSNLIITGGFGAAFKFVKKTLAYMKSEGLTLACFVNPRAHDDGEMQKLRKILNSVMIEKEKLYK